MWSVAKNVFLVWKLLFKADQHNIDGVAGTTGGASKLLLALNFATSTMSSETVFESGPHPNPVAITCFVPDYNIHCFFYYIWYAALEWVTHCTQYESVQIWIQKARTVFGCCFLHCIRFNSWKYGSRVYKTRTEFGYCLRINAISDSNLNYSGAIFGCVWFESQVMQKRSNKKYKSGYALHPILIRKFSVRSSRNTTSTLRSRSELRPSKFSTFPLRIKLGTQIQIRNGCRAKSP